MQTQSLTQMSVNQNGKLLESIDTHHMVDDDLDPITIQKMAQLQVIEEAKLQQLYSLLIKLS